MWADWIHLRTQLRQDLRRDSFQTGNVVHVEPLSHHPLDTGLSETTELLDDRTRLTEDDATITQRLRIGFESFGNLRFGGTNRDTSHERPAHRRVFPVALIEQSVETRREFAIAIGGDRDRIPLIAKLGGERE